MIPLASNDTLGIRNSWEWGFRQNMFPIFLPGFYSEAALPPISSLFAFENRKKHARTPLEWWEWGKDKSFYSEAVVLPVSLLFAAAVTWGWNIRLCEIRSEAFSIGALWCLWSSTIQNRTRIEFPEIWKASTDTFSIAHHHRRLD